MNILYYLRKFPKLSESFVLNEIYELEDRDHEVAIFSYAEPDEDILHNEFEELDVTVHYADSPSYTGFLDLLSSKVVHPDILQNVALEPSPLHAAALHRTRQCIEFIERLEFDVDLVHTHFPSVKTLPALYVASYFDSPFTVTTHAFNLYRESDRNLVEHMLSNADHAITISEYNERYIRDEITDTTPISVIRAGICPEKFESSTTSTDMRILTISRLSEKKGLPYAIQAIADVSDMIPGIEYHIIGSGPKENEIKSQIDEYGLNDTVKILGNVSDDRLITEFDEASCFLLPCVISGSGDRDGIPVVLMESMAMETPPISTEVSGIPELVDHQENGLLVEPRNVDELAEAITTLLFDPTKQREFGNAGRKKVIQDFNIKREAAKLESVFIGLLDQH